VAGLINTTDMKAKFLKIAGVKSEKEFYKKYPTEAAFFKAHPEAKKQVKKAQMGSYIGGEEEVTGFSPINFADIQDRAEYLVTGQDLLPETNQSSEVDLTSPMQNYMYYQSMYPSTTQETTTVKTDGTSDGTGTVSGKKGRKVTKAKGGFDISSIAGNLGPMGIASAATDVISGIQQLKEQKQNVKKAEQALKVSDVAAQAAATRPEIPARKYVRPEDMLTNPNERFMSYGTGTNILSAEEGAQIGGNPTEIQNMYSPGTIYLDLGFEPLMESDKVKNYQRGGRIPTAEGGFDWANFAKKGGTDIAGQFANVIPGVGQDAGSSIGSGLGSAVGSMFGPVGSMVGKFAGKVIGGLIDQSDKKIEKFNEKRDKNIGNIALQQGAQALQGQFSGFVRNGGNIPTGEDGWVSHDWQPQVITKFGEYDVEDLLKPDPTMDTLRTGGNIRQNNIGPQQQMSFGGEMKTHWGGYAEPISYNPYLPGTGETIMFRGQSHEESDGKGRTGIGVSYGDTGNDSYTDYAEYGTEAAEDKVDVEVERNEPAIETQDASGEKSMLVYGNLKIPKQFASQIGDPRLDHKNLPKFKNYVAKLSKEEEKANNRIARSVEIANNIKPVTSLDKLALDTQQTIIDANNLKLKQTALYKMNAAALQQAINDTGEELGIDADALAKGKIKAAKIEEEARNGKSIPKAQQGAKTPKLEIEKWLNERGREWDLNARKELAKQYGIKNFTGTIKQNEDLLKKLKEKPLFTAPKLTDEDYKFTPPQETKEEKEKREKKEQEDYTKRVEDLIKRGIIEAPKEQKNPFKENYEKLSKEEQRKVDLDIYQSLVKRGKKSKIAREQATGYLQFLQEKYPDLKTKEGDGKEQESLLNTLKAVSSQVAPFLNKPYSEDLDPSQILGELTALGTNQLEPVQAQSYQPDLAVPMGDISMQDQLNANQADFNALQRIVGYNPEALSQLAAQKYTANQKTLADQFRLNQELRNQVFNKNRDTLNDARVKNLAIYDQQYQRQEQAKSNTKAVFQEAMNSIASKTLQNQSENKTLAAYSNMFPQYGFDSAMRARARGLTFFNMPDDVGTQDKDGTTTGTTTPSTTSNTTTNAVTNTPSDHKSKSKHGGKTKKSFANSSILKMYKG